MQGIHMVSISAACIELSRENKNLLLILFALFVINRLLRSHVTLISNSRHFQQHGLFQLPVTELFTGGENRRSPAEKENPEHHSTLAGFGTNSCLKEHFNLATTDGGTTISSVSNCKCVSFGSPFIQYSLEWKTAAPTWSRVKYCTNDKEFFPKNASRSSSKELIQ